MEHVTVTIILAVLLYCIIFIVSRPIIENQKRIISSLREVRGCVIDVESQLELINNREEVRDGENSEE